VAGYYALLLVLLCMIPLSLSCCYCYSYCYHDTLTPKQPPASQHYSLRLTIRKTIIILLASYYILLLDTMAASCRRMMKQDDEHYRGGEVLASCEVICNADILVALRKIVLSINCVDY